MIKIIHASRIIQQCFSLLRQQGPGEGPGVCWPHDGQQRYGWVWLCVKAIVSTCKGASMCSALLLKSTIFDNVPVHVLFCSVEIDAGSRGDGVVGLIF